MELKSVFMDLCTGYTADEGVGMKLWRELEKAYSGPKRAYHSFGHLESLLQELEPCKEQVVNWNAVLFAVFYHDIIYNVRKKDNEEQSAIAGAKALQMIGADAKTIKLCYEHILATKAHRLTGNSDTDLFTDADLSILGKDRDTYSLYCQQVRKEYKLYPDILYKPGRRKVVAHFLDMPRIFKTTYFFTRYEAAARANLRWELEALA